MGGLASGVGYFSQVIMQGVGAVDIFLSAIMAAMGLGDPQSQLYVLIVLAVALGATVLRAVGGVLSWILIIFLVLMLLHHAVPSFS